jgi:hypothetical protein
MRRCARGLSLIFEDDELLLVRVAALAGARTATQIIRTRCAIKAGLDISLIPYSKTVMA